MAVFPGQSSEVNPGHQHLIWRRKKVICTEHTHVHMLMRGSVHLLFAHKHTRAHTSRGLWLMGSLLMLSQDYRWLRWLDTNLTSVQTHTHTHTSTHAHTISHTFSSLSRSHRCTYTYKSPISANKATHPDIPLSCTLALPSRARKHTRSITREPVVHTGLSSFLTGNDR